MTPRTFGARPRQSLVASHKSLVTGRMRSREALFTVSALLFVAGVGMLVLAEAHGVSGSGPIRARRRVRRADGLIRLPLSGS